MALRLIRRGSEEVEIGWNSSHGCLSWCESTYCSGSTAAGCSTKVSGNCHPFVLRLCLSLRLRYCFGTPNRHSFRSVMVVEAVNTLSLAAQHRPLLVIVRQAGGSTAFTVGYDSIRTDLVAAALDMKMESDLIRSGQIHQLRRASKHLNQIHRISACPG